MILTNKAARPRLRRVLWTRWLVVLVMLAGLVPLASVGVVVADDAVVGDGAIESCSDAALDAALASVQASGGGTITFDCGGAATIEIETTKTISAGSPVAIDGGGLITLDGGGERQIFSVPADATLTLTGLMLTGGYATIGGAIHNAGTLTVMASTFTDNVSTGSTVFEEGGGAIYNSVSGTADIRASTFHDNDAARGGAVRSLGALTITASAFERNESSAYGGAIYNNGALQLVASTFNDNNTTAGGGAIYQGGAGGSLTVTASTFLFNSAGAAGGAIFAAIYDPNGADVVASTFHNNDAARGAALYGEGELINVTSSTFYANSASDRGGAIYSSNNVTWMRASTFSGNSAADSGGTLYQALGTTVVEASILTDSMPAICAGSGARASFGYNVVDDTSCDFNSIGDAVVADALLGPLDDSGGPTETMLPDTTSPAAGAIPADDCLTYSSSPDQRGVDRP